MSFRVTEIGTLRQVQQQLQRGRADLARVQERVASGRRLQSLGDDPGDAARALGLRRDLARNVQHERNIDAARARLERSESELASLSGVLVRARELAVSADVERDQFGAIRAEVEQLFSEVARVANAREGNSFLFAGFASDQPPFPVTGAFQDGVPSPPPAVAFAGDAGSIDVAIGAGERVQSNVSGAAVFRGDADGDGATDPGRADLFEALRDLRNRLLDPETFGSPAGAIPALDQGLSQVNEERASAGGRLARLERARAGLEDREVVLERERSAVEDLDFATRITELRAREAAFQASLASAARILQPSLLDFLG